MAEQRKEAAWKRAKRQRILETGFHLFADKSIEAVTMPAIAEASGVGRATLYRYYPTKADLVIAIGVWKWQEYIERILSPDVMKVMEGRLAAERLRYRLDIFIELYRNHSDLLRYNYNFNSFLLYEAVTTEQKKPYVHFVDSLRWLFHNVYEAGRKDGTINTDIPEEVMFSSSFHIMLAAVTRYAVGLVYMPEEGADPESELRMLEEMLLARFTRPLPAAD